MNTNKTDPMQANLFPARPARRTASSPAARWLSRSAGMGLGLALLATANTSFAQREPNFPITPGQRSTAQEVAQRGVPLSELSPNAPDSYTVKRGDTLWDISGIFLTRPWRWPELWGMNLQQIRNPHLIFPGQVLYLTRIGDRAFLSLAPGDVPTVKLSPRIRSEMLDDGSIPPIPLKDILPFLTEPLIVDAEAFAKAPRIVATQETRVLLSRGDRAYARGQYGNAAELEGSPLSAERGSQRDFRVFRNAVELRDPTTKEILGYEAQFVGKANLTRGETLRDRQGPDGTITKELEPATIDIALAKEEIRVGDRLIPEPPRVVPAYVPRAPQTEQRGQIVAVHGSAVQNAGQNQVVIINKGTRDGMETGHVLAILKDGAVLPDTTDTARPNMVLPNERNGLMMVFLAYERVSYALVLQITDGVKVGDRFMNP
jgi:hypothetical protein